MSFSYYYLRVAAVLFSGLLAGTAMLGVDRAEAVPIEWTIEAIFQLDAPTTVSGTIAYDADTGLFSDSTLVVTGSVDVGDPTNFFNIISTMSDEYGFWVSNGSDEDLTGDHAFYLVPNFDGSNTFASVGDFGYLFGAAFVEFAFACANADCSSVDALVGADLLQLTNVSAVPLPPGLALFGSGLAIMGFVGWRRKSKAVAA